MKQCGYGYYVDTRQDNKNRTGVLESCKFFTSFTHRAADIIFTISSNGEIVKPYYLDATNGFIPLTDKIDVSNEGLEKFLNSHKATFGVLGSFVAIVEAKLRFDLNTHQLAKSNISFYLPKTVIPSLDGYTDNKGNHIPVIITQKCTNKDSFLTRAVNPKVLQMYESKVIQFLTYDVVEDKESYMRARLNIDKE